MENKQHEVDLVYLWVDGNDLAWQAKRNALIGAAEESSSVNCKGRYANNDELKFSLRSIEQHAPWIRKIFIVTDNQTPDWLDTSNPRVEIVDHSTILSPESLPCFNSCVIEHHLWKIPGLAEHFLYANDDMLLGREVKVQDFFTSEGMPIVRLTRKPFRKLRWFFRENVLRKPLRNYSKKIALAARLVEERFGVYFTGMPHHNIDAYLKSDLRHVAEEVLREEFLSNSRHKKRSDDDVQRVAFSYIALAERRALLRYVTCKESMIVRIHKSKDYAKFLKHRPTFFCMNDSEYANSQHRTTARAFLEKIFPQKSPFER